jgi:hypothetical protein
LLSSSESFRFNPRATFFLNEAVVPLDDVDFVDSVDVCDCGVVDSLTLQLERLGVEIGSSAWRFVIEFPLFLSVM